MNIVKLRNSMLRVCVYALLIAAVSRLAGAANPARYMGRLQNGTVIEGNTLSDWHASGLMPKLEYQPLLEPTNPFRWLIDRSMALPPPPEAYIEFVTGDRLPAVVQGFRTGNEFAYSPRPAYLLVDYFGANPANLERQTSTLRIDTRFIRRIVWRATENENVEPGTAILVGGNIVRFRSVRFASNAATLLTPSGIRRLLYTELAELHMPDVDFWPIAFDELAVLTPHGQARLLQLETSDGLIATTSLDRYLPRVVGDARDVNRWVHGLQPAWSLDVIWVAQGTVRTRRSFAPHEVPLTRVPVKRFEQRSTLGDVHFPLAVNRNVLGGPQRCSTRDVGWGLGVHALAAIEYELPPETRAIQSEFAIDASMNDGGCVLPRIMNTTAGGETLYEGPIVVGSNDILNSGVLVLAGPTDAVRRISLQVDPVLNIRPPGADPFDIRDNVNWVEPIIELDVTRLQRQLDERALRSIPGWREWAVAVAPGTQTKWSTFFAEAPGNLGEFAPAISVASGALVLTSKRNLIEGDRWLVIDAVRTQSSNVASKVSVQLGDQKPTEHELPTYDKSRSDFRPIVLSVADAAQRPGGAIEIRQLSAENTSVLWRSVSVTSQHPMLFQLFEDDTSAFAKTADAASSETKFDFDDQQKYFGSRSLVLTKDAPLQINPSAQLIVRERPQLGEYRFLRLAVRKQNGGGLRVQLKHGQENERPATYETGPKPPADIGIRYLSNAPLKDEWQIFTRDLFSDFGNIDIGGLTIEIADGTKVWIDHIYFARTQSDFDLIKK